MTETIESQPGDHRAPGRKTKVRKTLTGEELRRELELSHTTFYRYKRLGKFDRFLLSRRPIGPRIYSGELVQRYLDGLK